MLNVDLDQLKVLGENISAKAEEFKTVLTNINAVNENLSQYWQGADAQKYIETVKLQAEEMQKLYEVLVKCGEYITAAKNAYQGALDANMGN